MIKPLAVAAVAGTIILGAPAVALAHWDDERHEYHHDRAPEPVTIIGLSVGVAGIVAARWAWGRKSARKR